MQSTGSTPAETFGNIPFRPILSAIYDSEKRLSTPNIFQHTYKPLPDRITPPITNTSRRNHALI